MTYKFERIGESSEEVGVEAARESDRVKGAVGDECALKSAGGAFGQERGAVCGGGGEDVGLVGDGGGPFRVGGLDGA